MTASSSIATVVRWLHRLHGPARGWIGAIVVVGFSAVGGPAQAAALNPGDILIADGMIFAVNPVTGNQTPVATGGSLVNPVSIAIGSDGDLYVLDLGCCGPIGGQPGLIRVDPATGGQTVISSGGHFVVPVGIAISATGTLYVVDTNTCCSGPAVVIQVDRVTGQQAVVASGQYLHLPAGIAIASSGDLYVVDPACCIPSGGASSR